MSTLAYAALTSKREESEPTKSTSTSPPGVGNYVDALAAVVPAEVLTLHAVILSATTSIKPDPATLGGTLTQITDPLWLSRAFYGLIVLSILLYVVPRLSQWDKLDYLRAAIPPVAFVAWTMLQRATAFDAIAPGLSDSARTVIGLFVAVLVALVAGLLATRADRKVPVALPKGGHSADRKHLPP